MSASGNAGFRQFYQAYGVWTLLLSWAPIIGDPLTVLAGAARTPLTFFILLVIVESWRVMRCLFG